jgi:hypothetical protein
MPAKLPRNLHDIRETNAMSTRPLAATAARRPKFLLAVLGSWVIVFGFAAGALAQTWNESGDAGALPGTAQSTVGAGSITAIAGNLDSPSDVDMYCIQVQAPATFSARLQCVVIQGPNLWLFDSMGKGVAANSICVGGDKRILSTFVSTSGKYYVAVSFNGVNPFAGADPIWVPANTGERAPDGAGAAGAVTSWQGSGQLQPLNPYQVLLTSVAACEAPVPTTPQVWGHLKEIYR